MGNAPASVRQHLIYLVNHWVTCNDFWSTMVRRNFPFHHFISHIDTWNRRIPGGDIHHRPSCGTIGSRDIQGILEQTQGNMSFLPEEDFQAKVWLRQQGWREGEPFACLLVRDHGYLSGKEWDYHNYRYILILPHMCWQLNGLRIKATGTQRMGKDHGKAHSRYSPSCY